MSSIRTALTACSVAAAGALLVSQIMRQRRRMTFRDRSVIITGGSRGLGLLLARAFGREGAKLTLLARDADELRRAELELLRYNGRVLTVQCDVRDRNQVEAAVDQIMQRFGRIDVLINNAGVIQVGPFEHMRLEDFERAMAIHYWGPLHFIRAVLPHMRQQGGGRIVNISSIGGKVAVPHLLPYCASKFALTGLSDGLRAELAKDNIRVTTVCPWLMRTGSYLQATFKGQRSREMTWFALGASLPLVSMDAHRAVKRIVEACRYGEAETLLAPQGRAIAILNAVFPSVVAGLSATVAARLLPRAVSQQGDQALRGMDLPGTRLAPSLLTRLADRAAERNNELAPELALTGKESGPY